MSLSSYLEITEVPNCLVQTPMKSVFYISWHGNLIRTQLSLSNELRLLHSKSLNFQKISTLIKSAYRIIISENSKLNYNKFSLKLNLTIEMDIFNPLTKIIFGFINNTLIVTWPLFTLFSFTKEFFR